MKQKHQRKNIDKMINSLKYVSKIIERKKYAQKQKKNLTCICMQNFKISKLTLF